MGSLLFSVCRGIYCYRGEEVREQVKVDNTQSWWLWRWYGLKLNPNVCSRTSDLDTESGLDKLLAGHCAWSSRKGWLGMSFVNPRVIRLTSALFHCLRTISTTLSSASLHRSFTIHAQQKDVPSSARTNAARGDAAQWWISRINRINSMTIDSPAHLLTDGSP